jgi:hypothetical protein
MSARCVDQARLIEQLGVLSLAFLGGMPIWGSAKSLL